MVCQIKSKLQHMNYQTCKVEMFALMMTNWWKNENLYLPLKHFHFKQRGETLKLKGEIGQNNFFPKNLAYGRQRISWPMWIVGPIQFLIGCMIYLKKKNKKKFNWVVDASTRPCVHATAPCVGDGRSAPTPRSQGSTHVIRWAPHM